MAFVASYPAANAALKIIYLSVLPQVAVLVVAQGLIGRPERIYGLCLAVSAGAAISIFTWTLMPSFGAFSVYDVSKLHMALALDTSYAHQLTGLLAHGPGRISPTDAKGLIGFPSYHATLALLVTWYARDLKLIRWLALGINVVVIAATPVQGGHHVIDVLAGFVVAALAIAFANLVMGFAARSGAPASLTAQTANP
jgi:membrane-associated phospholipid phosphatase